MYKILFLILLIFSNNCFANITSLLNTNPNEVLLIVDSNRALDKAFISNIDVVDINLKNNTENKFSLVVAAEKEKSFAIYKSPNNQKGQTILNIGQNIWIYIPKTSNPIKISPQQKLVGQASIADIVSLLYYNNYNIKGYNKDNNNYLLNLQSNNKNNAYDSIDLVVDDNGFPIKAVFYSLSKKVLKTMYFEEVKQLAGKKRPTTMRIVNEIDKNLITTIHFNTMEEKNIPKAHFNKEFISKLANAYSD